MNITLSVNGEERSTDVEPRRLLVHHLRDDLGLTGTNVGCDTSSCGACTVLMDGESVKSCTVLAVQADGHEITTIEGLGGEPPAPLTITPPACTRCSRPFTSSTACSVGSAPPAW